MSITGTDARYGAVAQTFHWLTAILVVAAYALSEDGPHSFIYSEANAAALKLHESLGVAVFALVLLRLLWRAVDRAPQDPPMPAWMHRASTLTHWGLYALLLAVPLTAIFGAWADGHPVMVYRLGPVGPFFGDSGLGFLARIHGLAGEFILWLAGLHAAAAISHHVILRDRVLKSMLPARFG